MAGTAATVSVLGLIVFGTLASLLGKIGKQHFCRIRLPCVFRCTSQNAILVKLIVDASAAVYELSGDDFNGDEKLFRCASHRPAQS